MSAQKLVSTHNSWQTFPFWTICRPKSVTGHHETAGLLSVYLDRGVIPYSEGGGLVHKPSESLEKYQLVESGDLVMNNQQAWRGSVGISRHKGIVSPAYLVFSLDKKRILPGFASYLFRDKQYIDKYMLSSLSVGDIQRQLKWHHLRRISLNLPDIPTQSYLSNLLDCETARIDTLIAKKTRFIELLKEKRQAVITKAVTKGLDDSVKMKDGGFKSVGQIPAHWELSPVARALRYTKRTVGNKSSEFKLLSLTIKGVIERDVSENFGKFPESFDTYQEVNRGDFVFCLFDMDETPRTVGRSELSGMITGAYSVFKCTDPEYANYLAYFFLHLDNCKGLKPFYTGLRKTIRPPKFSSIRIPFPPKREAEQIANYLNYQTNRIDVLIMKTERSIELLKEKRFALITAAVTGKIVVREAA